MYRECQSWEDLGLSTRRFGLNHYFGSKISYILGTPEFTNGWSTPQNDGPWKKVVPN